MVKERKRISRHGLTCCPKCNRYTNARTGGLECQFCGENVLSGGAGRTMRALMNGGRSGLLAASLFGLAALPACDEGNDPAETATGEISSSDSLDGLSADGFDVAPEYTAGDVYGLPPDIQDSGPEAGPFDVAPEATFGDAYGAPADIPDAFEVVPDTTDVPSDAVYGAPPDVSDG